MPFKHGSRVIVDLTGLESAHPPEGVTEGEGVIIQRPGEGLYDVMFYPEPPYAGLSMASWVPERLIRAAERNAAEASKD